MDAPARPTLVRHYVLLALLVITVINYVQRNCVGPAATTIEASIGVTSEQLDLAAGAFFLTYTLFQIPSGWLAKRFGPRLVLPFYAVGWSLALAACAGATGYLGLYVGRMIMGVFQAGIFPAATLVLAVWYPPSLRGTATALLNSCMLMGGAVGGAMAGYLLNPVGFPYLLSEPLSWQGLFLLYSVPGVVWAVFFVLWFRDRPEDHPGVNAAEVALLSAQTQPTRSEERTQRSNTAPASLPGPSPSLVILLALPVLLLCTQQFFRAASPRFFDFRLATYLERERDLNVKQANALAAWPQYAGVIGGLVGGVLSDWLLRRTRSRYLARNVVAISGLALCLVWYVLAYFTADVTLACVWLSVGAFFFNFSSPMAYASVIDVSGKHLPIVFGAMNMAGNLGAYALTSLFMSWVAWGGWPFALGLWVLLPVGSLLCWLVLDLSKTLEER
jgi:MFS family permease